MRINTRYIDGQFIHVLFQEIYNQWSVMKEKYSVCKIRREHDNMNKLKHAMECYYRVGLKANWEIGENGIW